VGFRRNGDASLKMILVGVWVRLQHPDRPQTVDPVNPSRPLVYPVQLVDDVASRVRSVVDADDFVGVGIRRNATAYLDPIACCLA